MIGADFLQRLPAGLRVALAAAGEEIAERAGAGAPRASGALASSISARADGAGVVVIAAAPHAAAVELGGFARAPRPFLRPALLEGRETLRARIYQALREMTHD